MHAPQVGIGNALAGMATSAIEAYTEGRELGMESRIVQKFCRFVKCAWTPLPADKQCVGSHTTKKRREENTHIECH